MKRDIFSELKDGLEALAEERQGKVTLRTHKVKRPKLSLPEDFDAPLPDDMLDDFEGMQICGIEWCEYPLLRQRRLLVSPLRRVTCKSGK